MEEERRAGDVGISSRPVSATRYVHGDLVQAIVMLAPAGSDVGFEILAIARSRSPPQSRPRTAKVVGGCANAGQEQANLRAPVVCTDYHCLVFSNKPSAMSNVV
jgi:hypothetical protein